MLAIQWIPQLAESKTTAIIFVSLLLLLLGVTRRQQAALVHKVALLKDSEASILRNAAALRWLQSLGTWLGTVLAIILSFRAASMAIFPGETSGQAFWLTQTIPWTLSLAAATGTFAEFRFCRIAKDVASFHEHFPIYMRLSVRFQVMKWCLLALLLTVLPFAA